MPASTIELTDAARLELRIARVLVVGTYLGVALLAVGMVLQLAAGTDPLSAVASPLDLGRLPADLIAVRPASFQWAGLLVVMALPVTRVVVAAAAFTMAGDRRMAGIAVAVVIVLAVSVVLVQLEGG
jgi:uncharacterized membrane protein